MHHTTKHLLCENCATSRTHTNSKWAGLKVEGPALCGGVMRAKKNIIFGQQTLPPPP